MNVKLTTEAPALKLSDDEAKRSAVIKCDGGSIYLIPRSVAARMQYNQMVALLNMRVEVTK